jgi:two-component system chemotaxis sensor kinase CheA
MRREELIDLFRVEADAHLGAARRQLARLAEPEPSALREVLRSLHSVKGMAASLGFEELARAAHEAEEAVRRLREAPDQAEPGALGGIDRRVAALAAALAEVATSAGPEELPPVSVDGARLERLVELAALLSTSQQRLGHLLGPPGDPRELAERERLRGAVEGLAREVLALRLVPLRMLVAPMERSVRRWAALRGVEVVLATEGAELEVDRAVAERLLDPIGHLVRNAIAHGIEPPDARRAAGKPERGAVHLRFARDGERVLVEVADDGRGLSPAGVVRRAVSRGVLPAPPDPPLPDGAALLLLAEPGLAAGGRADGLSGRGVGLAAVRQAVESAGGELELASQPGAGFRARLLLPARLTLTDVFVVQCGGQRFVLPATAVLAVADAATASARSLAAALGLPAGAEASGTVLRVVAAGGEQELVVDRVEARRPLVVRPLGPPLDSVPPWSGAALLPDGGVALAVDPARLP